MASQPAAVTVVVACTGCGHMWQSTAADRSTVRCPECKKPRKVKRPAMHDSSVMPPTAYATVAMPVQAAAVEVPPGLTPIAVRRCELCALRGKRGRDGRNPLAVWSIRIVTPDGNEMDGQVCDADALQLVTSYAGRGARVRLDPAGPMG